MKAALQIVLCLSLLSNSASHVRNRSELFETDNSLQLFFRALVARYNPSELPQHKELLAVENKIPSAAAEDIAAALPDVIVAMKHPDERVKLYAASALFAVSLRTDSSELLRSYAPEILAMLDMEDARLQGTPMMVFANMKPAPPREIVPPLVSFLRKQNRDERAQASAVSIIVRAAPEDSAVSEVTAQFLSRPLNRDAMLIALNGLNGLTNNAVVVDAILPFLKDSPLTIQLAVIRALTGMGRSAVLHAQARLQTVLQDPAASDELKMAVKKVLDHAQQR